MTKFILTVLIMLFIINAKAQLIVDAPILEKISSMQLKNQVKSTEEQVRSQLNTLNTSKNTLESLDKIKEIDKRITEVSSKLKQIGAIKDIFDMGTQLLGEVKSTTNLINKYSSKDRKNAQDNIKLLQGSVTRVEEMIDMCRKVLSSDFAMNDFERITLLNQYKEDISAEIYSASKLKKRYSFMVGINAF